MATEDQDILARIGQLAGTFDTDPDRTPSLTVTFQARLTDTRTIKARIANLLTRRARDPPTPVRL
jgi:hypothetical protein